MTNNYDFNHSEMASRGLFLAVSVPLSTGERSARVSLQPRSPPHVWKQAESQLGHGSTHRPVRGLTSRYDNIPNVAMCACVHVTNICMCIRKRKKEIMERSRPLGPTERSTVSTRDIFKLLPLSSSYMPGLFALSHPSSLSHKHKQLGTYNLYVKLSVSL